MRDKEHELKLAHARQCHKDASLAAQRGMDFLAAAKYQKAADAYREAAYHLETAALIHGALATERRIEAERRIRDG